jgi:hypothetical protein
MTNIQKVVALVFGVVFLLVGILGFVPALTPGGALLGLFMVNGLHSIVHLLFGVLGIAAAFTGTSNLYNKAGGVIYLVLALVGFVALLGFTALAPGGMLLGLVMINMADNFLHLVLGLVLAYVGFGIQSSRTFAQRA